MRLPTGAAVQAAEAGRVWAVVHDSMDIPFVQVDRIAPPARGHAEQVQPDP